MRIEAVEFAGPLRAGSLRVLSMSTRHAEQQITIGAPPQRCFDALLEYETFPQWQRAVRSVEVLSRDSEGRGKEVAFEVDAKVRQVRYSLRYAYEEPHRISWTYVEGDIKEIEGEFILEDCGDGTTLATYSLALDAGVWMPGRLAKLLNEQVMRGSMEDLKQRAEASA
ncbi:MAG: hypothetical protein NVSMB25_22600 [Thermoleophilaceae bacterium]